MIFVDAVVGTALAVQLFATLIFTIFGAHCFHMVLLHARHKKEAIARDEKVLMSWNPKDEDLPVVTVQLPLFNEQYVVTRLVETITRLDYPRDRLEIQILDDSTDTTTEIARDLVEKYSQEGFDISLCHRTERTGFKAGALKEGNKTARGEFIAIFDADFVPEPDFLRKTLPFLEDPKIAAVQSLWTHLNGDYSHMTIAQSIGLDGGNYVYQSARCWSDAMIHFQGTGGVWRRTAIDDAGGWQGDTLTEDLDLSYRAQVKGWKLKYLPHVRCPGEIPATIAGVKSQQHRWTKGAIQNAYKLIPMILRSDLSGHAKFEAIFHMLTLLIHPCVLIIALSWPVQILLWGNVAVAENPIPGAIILFLCLFGPATLFIYAQKELYPNWKMRAHYFIYLMVWSTGVSLNNTKAVFEGLFKMKSGFVRTPKYRLEEKSGSIKDKAYGSKLGGQFYIEVLLAAYCLFGIAYMISRNDPLFDPFMLIFSTGICLVVTKSLREKFWQSSASRKSRTHQEAPAAARQI